MKRILKWAALLVVVVAVCGFGAFLYNIPPFFLTPPEEFDRQMTQSPPSVADIADPAERAIAEHGRYIVMTNGCIGCHAVGTTQGPDLTRYLGGGAVQFHSPLGTFVSRNLTPDKDTGLGRRSDEEVKRVLRSGVFADGHVVSASVMPWASFSNWSEEDRHAVLVYLRHLPPIRHATPEPSPGTPMPVPGAIEVDYAARDYGSR
jgi:hypothetical protein